jgi:hypothetical protein
MSRTRRDAQRKDFAALASTCEQVLTNILTVIRHIATVEAHRDADESQVFQALAALIEPVCTDLSALTAGLSERQQSTESLRNLE